MNHLKAIAQRLVNADTHFITLLSELHGFSEADATKIFKTYRKLKCIKLDAYMGRGALTQNTRRTQMTNQTTIQAKDTPIEFDNGCLWQANAVELTNGVIVFDCCGKCASCARDGLTEGVAAKDNHLIQMATQDEICRQDAAITKWSWS